MGVVLQNLIGFAELDILKILSIDLQDLQEKTQKAISTILSNLLY